MRVCNESDIFRDCDEFVSSLEYDGLNAYGIYGMRVSQDFGIPVIYDDSVTSKEFAV